MLFLASGWLLEFLHRIKVGLILRLLVVVTVTTLPLVTVLYPLEYYCSQRGTDASLDRQARLMINKLKAGLPQNSVLFSSFLSDYCFLHGFAVVDKLIYKSIDDLENFLETYHVAYWLMNRQTDEQLVSESKMLKNSRTDEVDSIGNIVLFKYTYYYSDN